MRKELDNINIDRLRLDMLNRKGTTSTSADRRLVQVSRMFFEEHVSKTQIATLQNISITHVNRLLREAQRKGIVQVLIKPPRFEDLESRLMRRFRVRDARVIQTVHDSESLRAELALEGARYFDEKVSDGCKVGVSSGRTMFEMASAVPEKNRKVSVYPLNVIVNQDSAIKSVSANTVATVLWFRSRPSSTAYQVELFFPDELVDSVRKTARTLLETNAAKTLLGDLATLNLYFLGTSELRPDSQLVTLAQLCGANLSDLASRGIVGDIAFNTLNERGECVSAGLEDLTFHISISSLKRAAADEKRSVILVAGGNKKIHSIVAALRARIVNTLITDSDTATDLLALCGAS